jgi:glycosyltransferase involved in cell wall biosynthesis
LLANARALLFPIDWPEPFGLVMIEALACGTPVIARRRGSVPEILRDGQTGFVCETDDEMCEAVSRLSHIDRRRCRSDFESRFTDTRMTQQYVALYEALCADVAMPLEAGEHRDPRIDPDGDTPETEIGNGPRRRVFSIDGGKPGG